MVELQQSTFTSISECWIVFVIQNKLYELITINEHGASYMYRNVSNDLRLSWTSFHNKQQDLGHG